MQYLFIKYYQKVTNMAFENLRQEKKFQFRKMLTNHSLLKSVESHYDKISKSSEARKLVKDYMNSMNNMHKLASKEYNDVLKKLKATNDKGLKQQILNEYADRGITGFVAKNGARWNVETYSNMYTTHMNNELIRISLLENIKKNQLVKINKSEKPCDWCKPYEGKILTQNELIEAKSNGLFHVRCKHFAYPI